MVQIATGGINNAGMYVEEWSLSWYVSGSVDQTFVGSAVTWDSTANNTVKIAGAATGAGVSTYTPVAVAAGGNTGNPTFGTITPGATAKAGAYLLTMTSATTFNLVDPSGDAMPAGTLGTAYSDTQLGFTLTAGGTPAATGDRQTITLTQTVAGSGQLGARVIGRLEVVEVRAVEGVTLGTVVHEGVYDFAYTGAAPLIGGSVMGSTATPGSVVGIPYQGGYGTVVSVDTVNTACTVLLK